MILTLDPEEQRTRFLQRVLLDYLTVSGGEVSRGFVNNMQCKVQGSVSRSFLVDGGKGFRIMYSGISNLVSCAYGN